jgi:hypothetical protein
LLVIESSGNTSPAAAADALAGAAEPQAVGRLAELKWWARWLGKLFGRQRSLPVFWLSPWG